MFNVLRLSFEFFAFIYVFVCIFPVCMFYASLDVVVHLPVYLRSFMFKSFLSQFSPFVAQIKSLCNDPGILLLTMFAKDLTGCFSLFVLKVVGSGQVLWTCRGRNKTLSPSTSLPFMGEIAVVNTSPGGYLYSSKKRARWAEGFHELNGHVFNLERDGLRQVVLCPRLTM